MSAPRLLGRWRIPAEAAALSGLREKLRAAIHAAGMPPEAAGYVLLALDEACTNIIRHGYRNAPGQTLDVEALHDAGAESLIFHLLDYAPPVDPSKIKPRELDDIRPGGLGVHFIQHIMDAASYVPPPPGYGNCLRLSVRLGKTFAGEDT